MVVGEGKTQHQLCLLCFVVAAAVITTLMGSNSRTTNAGDVVVTTSRTEVPPRRGQEGCYVYVYPPQPALLNCTRCARQAGYRMEGLIVDRFLNSRFRCLSPERARWLLFPLDYACQISCKRVVGAPYNELRTNASRATADRLNPLFKTDLWQTRSRDHVFVFAHDKGAGWIRHDEQSIFDEMRKGLFVTTVSTFMPGNYQSYVRGWDIGIPSSQGTSATDVAPLDANELLSRKTMVFWAGGIRSGHASRQQLVLAFANHSRIKLLNSTGNFFTPEYFDNMDHSIFCLYLGGHTPQRWSGTLGAVLQARCLPLIVNDYSDPPFHDVLPWGKFSVSLSEKEMLEEGGARIEEIVRDKQRMKALVAAYNAHRNRLLFFSPPRDGDALTTLVQTLKLREKFKSPSRGHKVARDECRRRLLTQKLSRSTDAGKLSPPDVARCRWGATPAAWRTT